MKINIVESQPTLTAEIIGNCDDCNGSQYRESDASDSLVECGCFSMHQRVRYFNAARIPHSCFDADLARMRPASPGLNQDYRTAIASCQARVSERRGMCALTGEKGAGKTWIIAGVLRDAIVEQGLRGLYVNGRDAIGMLRAVNVESNDPRPDQIFEAMRFLRDFPLLVLDEVGHQRTAFAREIVSNTIAGRYDDGRPTLLATNFGRQEIEDVLGDSVADRIFGGGVAVLLPGGSRR